MPEVLLRAGEPRAFALKNRENWLHQWSANTAAAQCRSVRNFLLDRARPGPDCFKKSKFFWWAHHFSVENPTLEL